MQRGAKFSTYVSFGNPNLANLIDFLQWGSFECLAVAESCNSIQMVPNGQH
jgi:hypothetical protein